MNSHIYYAQGPESTMNVNPARCSVGKAGSPGKLDQARTNKRIIVYGWRLVEESDVLLTVVFGTGYSLDVL